MIERDNLHFNFREIDGYNKQWNIVFCSRDVGKTTALELDKILFPAIKRNLTCAYLTRTGIEITEDLIDSMEMRINRFLETPIHFIYAKKEFKDGVVSVYIIKDKKKQLVMKIISLGIQLQRLKKITIDNIHAIIFDEYVCNPKLNEKYVKGEAFKIKELYNTLQRFAYKPKGLKCYLCGNPYSKYSPMVVDLGIDTNRMKEGERIIGNNYVMECYKMSDELKKYILERNPLYEFDDVYREYAFNGVYVNDTNIKLGKMPSNYFLKFVFNIEGVYLGIFKNDYLIDREDKYFVRKIKFEDVRKSSYCFDFSDLVNGSILMSNEEKALFSHFKQSMRNRAIAFENIECYYLCEEIYKNI